MGFVIEGANCDVRCQTISKYSKNAAVFRRGRSRSVSIDALSDYSGMLDEEDHQQQPILPLEEVKEESPPRRSFSWFDLNELYERQSAE